MPKTVSPPKYRHYKPRNLAVVRIAGKDHYLGTYGSKESREAYARLIAGYGVLGTAAATGTMVRDVSVTELCATYLEWASGYYVKNGRATSQVDVIRMSLRALRNLYGSTEAGRFGPLAFEALQTSLVDEGRTRSYVNIVSSELRRLFKWAARKELVPVAVHQALATVPGLARGRTTARENAPVLPVDDAVVEATLPFLPSAVAAMVRFQLLVGCRPSEICFIRPADVNTAGEVWTYTPLSHKTEHHGRKRRIFIGPRAQDVLRPFLLRPADAYCFRPETTKCTAIGHYTKDTFNRFVARACRAAGVPVWKPNQLRHAAATEVRWYRDAASGQVGSNWRRNSMPAAFHRLLCGDSIDSAGPRADLRRSSIVWWRSASDS